MNSANKGECGHCKQSIGSCQRFCENCGYGIEISPATVVCQKLLDGIQCNGLLKDGARFCSNCGSERGSPRSDEGEDRDIWDMTEEVSDDEDNRTIDVTALNNQLETDGATRTAVTIQENLDRWETEEVQFGIVGRSAMGKSSFINLMLDLSPEDPGHAKVGQGDCTPSKTEYEHPRFNSFKLVDFPGFGTLNMPKSKFLEILNSKNLHYFFIFFDTVFMEDDVWLVEILKEKDIPFSFVRAKIDIVVTEARESKGDEETEIAKLRGTLEATKNSNAVLRGSELFLISNLIEFIESGDLIKLIKHIVSLLPQGKIEAFIFFLPLLTPNLIEVKYKQLRKRIPFVAFLAGVVSAIPIPGIDIPLNIMLVSKEVCRYVRILNLDHQYVKRIPGIKHPSLRDMHLKESIKANLLKCFKLGIIAGVSQLDWLVLGVGSAIAGPLAIGLVAHHLYSELKILKADAKVAHSHLKLTLE